MTDATSPDHEKIDKMGEASWKASSCSFNRELLQAMVSIYQEFFNPTCNGAEGKRKDNFDHMVPTVVHISDDEISSTSEIKTNLANDPPVMKGDRDSVAKRRMTKVAARAFYESTTLESTVIPPWVVEIGKEAFARCGNLVTVYIAKAGQCNRIGVRAFFNCKKLRSMTIPTRVDHIGRHAFAGCALRTVDLSSATKLTSIEEGVFSWCWGLRSVKLAPNLNILGRNAFAHCTSLTSVDLHNAWKLQRIEECAFAWCCALQAVELPLSVEEIGDNAFAFCSRLVSIQFSTPLATSKLKTIGLGTFSYCGALVSIVIPPSIEEIGEEAFHHCTSLELVKLEGGKGNATRCKALKSIETWATIA